MSPFFDDWKQPNNPGKKGSYFCRDEIRPCLKMKAGLGGSGDLQQHVSVVEIYTHVFDMKLKFEKCKMLHYVSFRNSISHRTLSFYVVTCLMLMWDSLRLFSPQGWGIVMNSPSKNPPDF